MNLLIIHLIVCGICGALGDSVLTDCQVTISTVNWIVSGSCRVEQNVSNYNYSCEWEVDNERTSVGQSDSGDELCSFTQPLELTGDTYNYRVHFSPSSAAAVSGEVKIAQTGNSTKFRPQVVECGENLTCSCPTTTEDSEKLVKTNGQREDNGTQFTCHVTWAGRVYTSITYTLITNWTVEEAIRSIPVTSFSIETYVGVVVAVLALTGIATFLAVYFKRRYNYSRKAADQTPDLTGTELYASTSRREESRHRYSTLRHADTAYEEPLPPAQYPRGPSNPTSTPATHQEDTQYSNMELLPTEITYQAPIPPTQDVHTYMALHSTIPGLR